MSVFPRWMYHRELQEQLAKDAEHEQELREKGYAWHFETFPELYQKAKADKPEASKPVRRRSK